MNASRFFCCLLLLMSLGCEKLNLRSQSPDKDKSEPSTDEFETRVETPFIGDYTTITGLNLITLEGVGLVTGLDNTGGDPPPSMYRTALLEDMKKRGVPSPQQLLQSPTTALVVVRSYLPPLIRRGDRFDVEVRLPENSDATSLSGGWLLPTYLSEQAIVPGRGVLKGHIFAKSAGPILISTGEGGDDGSLAGVVRRGRILAGAVSEKDRDLTIYIRNDFRSVRNSKRIAHRIGKRFHSYNEFGLQEPLAEAKTDQTIVLKVHPRYRDNYPRFLQAIRNIAFRETPVAERVRMQRLQHELAIPEKSERAALRLEAIGHESIPVLKTGLKSPHLECRFHAATALAYLEDPSGLNTLAEAARDERAFRVFALAAMATVDDADSHMLLRDLMNQNSAELRYGSFRALWTLDKYDPFIRGESLNDEFALHLLDTEGEAMVHLAHRRRAEIVLFNRDQRFMTPMTVRAGNHILVTAEPGSDTITVSRYQLGEDDKRRVVSTQIADVIRTAAEFGASYPDIAQLLVQAEKQQNLPGRIEIDALPQSGRVYYRPGSGSGGPIRKNRARVGRSTLIPNMFPALDRNERLRRNESSDDTDDPEDLATDGMSTDSDGSGSASLADARDAGSAETTKPGRFDFLKLGRKSKSKKESPLIGGRGEKPWTDSDVHETLQDEPGADE